jgi:hypothetical protein
MQAQTASFAAFYILSYSNEKNGGRAVKLNRKTVRLGGSKDCLPCWLAWLCLLSYKAASFNIPGNRPNGIIKKKTLHTRLLTVSSRKNLLYFANAAQQTPE